jgi:quinol monooxygenase YgiN
MFKEQEAMRLFFGILMTAMVAAAPATLAQAPAAADQTAYVVTYLEVLPSAKGEAANLLKQVASASRNEAGNLRFDILQRIERDNQFAILEAWSDSKAAEAHGSGAALKQFKEKLGPLRASFYDERPSKGVAVAPLSAPAGKNAVYSIIHVDVTPPNTDKCIAMLRELAEATRKEPEALRFEAWQQSNRANHFTVMEVWKRRDGVEAHVVTEAARDFREKLGPMTGALYDERLYSSID